MKYRMYIDEVGNSDLKASLSNANHRYLSLTGVIFELGYVAETVQPRLEDLKQRYFGSHPDDPIVLHRKELVNQKPPFQALQDPIVKARFDVELLTFLDELDYVVVTAVIDKLAHLTQYREWARDPYHYCLAVLMERFALWLGQLNRVGDVMAESRGGKEDRRLKDEFQRIYRSGTPWVSHGMFVNRVTSSQLKMKAKALNVAGLQVADLLAHPSYAAMKARQEGVAQPTNFGGRIAAILEATKYRRRAPRGLIDGYGPILSHTPSHTSTSPQVRPRRRSYVRTASRSHLPRFARGRSTTDGLVGTPLTSRTSLKRCWTASASRRRVGRCGETT